VNTATTSDQQQIEQFLTTLRASLGPIALPEREEILREIDAHIHDSMELTGQSAATVIAKLGSPQQLAADYRDGALVRAASYSFSPMLLLRATLRIATKTLSGFIVFLFALTGYLTGISFLITAFLKPFFPDRTGVFVLDHHLYRIGIQNTLPPVPIHEVAGFWFVPASLVIASATLVLTTVVIRHFLRLSTTVQQKLDGYHPTFRTSQPSSPSR